MSAQPPAASFSSSQAQYPTPLPSSDHDSDRTLDGLSQGMGEHAAPNHTPPPSMEKHPKGRRKRTSAKDKMILEEAYSSNDKPDKQARLEIVKRVDLNEKEVQIWFQNRRQNDRRRSRPLSQEEIQEIAARRYSARQAMPSSDPVVNLPSNEPRPDPAPTHLQDSNTSSSPQHHHETTPSSLSRSHFAIVNNTPMPAGQDAVPRELPDTTPQHVESSPSQEAQGGPYSWSNSMLSSASSSVGYLANRRNIGNSFSTPSTLARGGDDSFKFESYPPPTCSPETSQPASQPQSQSSVRLSLSLEGKAELVSNQASPTPHPISRPSSTPSFLHQRQRSFGRSFSDFDDLTLPPIKGHEDTRHHPRLRRIRSRDVHAWESCADPDTRDELTAQAEHESNGSAIAAINLLRSSSGVLQLNMSKRNAPMPAKQPQAKRTKLGRAGSSIARLETTDPEKEDSEKDRSGKLKISRLLSPTDSDKENWSPGADGNPPSPHRRSQLPPYVPPKSINPRRRPLQAGMRTPNLLGSRASTAPARHRSIDDGIEIFEDSPKRQHHLPPPGEYPHPPERFARSGELSPSKRPDIDCAAGLLSLSRGGWQNRQPSL